MTAITNEFVCQGDVHCQALLSRDEDSLPAKEACEYIGISCSNLERYIAKRLITKYQCGIEQAGFFKQPDIGRH